MKKIFTLFAALAMVMSMSAETYRYSGEKDSWKGSTMTVSSDGYYSYYGPVTGAHQFKIGTSTNQWAYNHSYVSKGFNSTDITDLGDWSGDNAYCWSSKKHYILVYHPSTKINSSSKVKICASTFLPDDSETDLPEPEPEPTELAYNVTVPAGTKACYICGNMTGWKFTEMTKVNDTQYTITIEGAKKDDEYKYASGSAWDYVEKDNNGNEIGNRTYVDGNDVVAKWASVFDPDAVEQELTYNVTVPAGTYACYIAMDSDPAKNGWEFTAMTKVDDTHYTFKHVGLKNKPYKYSSGPAWDYEEQTADGGQVADRHWAEKDEVAKWKAVYDPTPIYTVKVTAENGTVEGLAADGKYKHGEQATLTAKAAAGYEFVNWTKGKDVVSANPYTFPVTENVTLVANFKKSVQTINLSYDITSENIGNRDGRRQTISVEDENYGNPQLIIPGFNVEVSEYAEAYLSVSEETMTATATYTVDAENGKEVYTATATTADGSIIYNVTFTLTAPAVEEHTIMNLEYPTVTVQDFGGSKMYIIEGEAVMDTEDNVVNFNLTVVPSMGVAEGGIGTEIYGSGEATMSEPVDGEVYVEATLVDDAGNIYNFFIAIEAIEEEEVEIVITDTVTLDGYQLVLENQGNMAMVSAQVNGIELSFYLTWNEEEKGYGTYEDASVTNVWYTIEGEEQQLTPYGNAHVYSAESLIVSCINTPDAEGNATLYQFTLYKGEKPEGPATSVGNVEVSAAAVKVIENGQLIVIKNGVKFNVLGAQVK